jgi:peroxiredoxin
MRSIFIFLVISVFAGLANAQNSGAAAGPAAPVMTLTDISGGTLNTRDLAGKIVVYNLWYVGCAGCMEEIPKLNAIVDEFPDVVFIGMSLSKSAEIARFVAKNPFKYRIVPGVGKEILINFGKTDKSGELNVEFPTHVVVDRGGFIEFRASGIKGIAGVRETLQRLAVKK